MVRSLPLVMLALIVAGCTQTYQSFDPPPLDFTSRPPLLLRVDRVRIDDATTPGAQAQTQTQNPVPVSPEHALRDMLDYRLRAAGGAGALRATILEASVSEQPLETAGGLRGYVTNEAVAELRGRFKVKLERLDERGESVGSLSTAASRTAALPEDATFVRRQEIAYGLIRDLVNDLDISLMSNLQDNFPTLLAPSA